MEKKKNRFVKWVYNNILLKRFVPLVAGIVLAILCMVNDIWVGAIIGLLFYIFPLGLQVMGYKEME